VYQHHENNVPKTPEELSANEENLEKFYKQDLGNFTVQAFKMAFGLTVVEILQRLF
jgi:hypothetical protein